MESVLFLVDAALIAGLGTWMAVAVADNWRHPKLNEEAVATVVRFDLMAQQYPEDFASVAHRRIEDRRMIGLMFRAMRLAETVAALLLFLAAALLIGAAFDMVDGSVATVTGVIAAAYFSCIWAGFVVGGNYFCYWYCHQWAQSNHYMVMYWGFFVLLVLLN
ncbi:MAG: DUF2165 family protein [Pseudomonadota bacterium]